MTPIFGHAHITLTTIRRGTAGGSRWGRQIRFVVTPPRPLPVFQCQGRVGLGWERQQWWNRRKSSWRFLPVFTTVYRVLVCGDLMRVLLSSEVGYMRSGLLVTAVVLASVSVLASSQEPKKSDKDNKSITVTGCVEGSILRVTEHDSVGTFRDQFRLAGSKSLMKEISKELQGHKVEVTGHVIDVRGTEHSGHTTSVGKKTSIYVGASEVANQPVGDDASTLQVKSYRDLFESCR